MKLKTQVALVIVLIPLMSGCAKTVRIKGAKEITGGSPLREIQRFSFIVEEFEDKREKRDIIGYFGRRKLLAGEKPTQLISQAIASELSRSGHEFQEKNSPQVDFEIAGILLEYWYTMHSGVLKTANRASVYAEISVKDVHTGDIKLKKQYRGFFETKSVFNTIKYVDTLFDEATNNLIKQFTADPDVINVLKSKNNKLESLTGVKTLEDG